MTFPLPLREGGDAESEAILKILALGDVVGRPGREIIAEVLPDLITEQDVSFVLTNAENAAGGSGLTPETVNVLFAAGVDCITTGDHVFRRKEIIPLLETDGRILRPANFPKTASGKGFTVLKARQGERVGVVNVLGRIFMKPIDDPFAAVDAALNKLAGETDVIIVDVHAEATSEKVAMGWHLDGRVTALVGTHTHVQTADERVLPKGTAYITDLGMTGPHESVLGRDVQKVLRAITTGMPTHFDVATGDVRLCGVLITADRNTHKASAIERIVLKTK
ncbi:MAG: metallophosphoesterase [Planctomycetes bacterium SM23_65]|nr:MAG: metallophosphoesterase [Planctomycetes bacterium SM23_65]